MKNILGIFLSVLVLSCGAQNYRGNDNLRNCTEIGISKIKYNFDIQNFEKRLAKPEYKQLEINTDSTKVFLMETNPSEANKKYYLDITSKMNMLTTVYVYDSIGRLIRKYNNHTDTKVGEEIKFKYSDIKSTTPIETYRVNYDTIYPVCWKEALRIATKKGIKPQEVHMDIQYPLNYWDKKKPMEWTIYDYEHIMYIDAFTGKATNLRKKGSGLPTN